MPASSKPRKPYHPRRTQAVLMRPDQVHQVFRPIDAILEALHGGLIETISGVPVFRDWHDQWCAVSPALEGWADCWDRIAREEGFTHINTAPVRRVASKLKLDSPLMEAEVARLAAVIRDCRMAIRRIPIERIRLYMKTEEIAAKVEALGLCSNPSSKT